MLCYAMLRYAMPCYSYGNPGLYDFSLTLLLLVEEECEEKVVRQKTRVTLTFFLLLAPRLSRMSSVFDPAGTERSLQTLPAASCGRLSDLAASRQRPGAAAVSRLSVRLPSCD